MGEGWISEKGEVMKDKEMEIIANKVADIIIDRFKEEQQELAKRMIDLLWDTPFDSSKYSDVIHGQSVRQMRGFGEKT